MMGKYAFYVWSSYALTSMVVVVCAWQATRRHRQVLREIRRDEAFRENRK